MRSGSLEFNQELIIEEFVSPDLFLSLSVGLCSF